MKIKKVSLRNFKCFDRIDVNLNRLTLLTGANSSGKSSIIYSLLGAIQSDNFPFEYSINGNYIKMGDYKDVIFNNDIDLTFDIIFDIYNKKSGTTNLTTTWENNRENNLPVLKALSIDNDSYRLDINKSEKYNLSFTSKIDSETDAEKMTGDILKQFVSAAAEILYKESSQKDSDFVLDNEFIKKFVGHKKQLDFDFDDFKELDRLVYTQGNISLSNLIKSVTEVPTTYEKKFNYISSFRLYPQRTYYEESQKNLKVGNFGEKYQDQLIDWENTNSDNIKELIIEMKKLKLIENIKLNRLGGGRFEVLVKINENSVYAPLNDVGFGVSQFLPIMVADAQLGRDSNFVIAQPEIHLHPSVQAKFGDYLIDQILIRRKDYVVETHSEYLINRIRLAIVKEIISEDDVSIYYLENDGYKSTIHEVKFLKNGQIINAPSSFFETYMIDVMDIALNA